MLPPFPEDIQTHPLVVIDYARIVAGDKLESDRLWDAATTLGFWYLKNHGVDAEVDAMFELGRETMALPLDEKMEYDQGHDGMSHGYKAAGASATDEHGTRDTAEYLNVAQDDALAFPQIVHRTYPRTVAAHMANTVTPFIRASAAVNATLLAAFDARLGLSAGALAARHSLAAPSGSQARVIRSVAAARTQVAIGGHTDFGSLTFLHNRLGGLQVLVPGTESWQYVRPVPGCAICNVGDALVLLSGGILKSNMHRVVPPPGEQYGLERWSVVFFTRPENPVLLRALEDESEVIKKAAEKSQDPQKYRGNSTASEWFARRVRNRRIKNRTGPETWRASRGTEHQPERV